MSCKYKQGFHYSPFFDFAILGRANKKMVREDLKPNSEYLLFLFLESSS